MSAPTYNPYAPPNPAAPAPSASAAVLPPGTRRFRLEPTELRAYLDRAVRRRARRLLVIWVLAGVFAAILNGATLMTLALIVFAALILGISLLGQRQRLRRATSREITTYELLLGPRVIRRTIAGMVPAEAVRPEVTRIYEIDEGLWVSCAHTRRSVFVVGAIDGFAEVREELRAWAPFEPLAGAARIRRGQIENPHQGPCAAIAGSALASDPTLVDELETLRAASMNGHVVPDLIAIARRKRIRTIVLWVLLILMFFAVYQFLSPANSPGHT